MKKRSRGISMAAITLMILAGACYAKDSGVSGEDLFKQHCAPCHSGGGNVVNLGYTLHKKDMKKHGVTKKQNIIEKMRHPGPGMTAFDKNTISDKDAEKIAEYVLKTF
jgi:cytochrome c6